MALRNPCDLLTMAHAGTTLHELGGFGTSIDLRNTQRALALGRFSERSAATGKGPPGEGPGPLVLLPREGAAASRNQFGLVNQVAGTSSSVDSYHDERTTRRRLRGPVGLRRPLLR